MNQDFYNKLVAIVNKEQIRQEELLSRHTTFRIGGPADYFVTAKTAGQAAKVRQLCQEMQVPFFLIGNGSNLLVSDRGFRGLVLKLSEDAEELTLTKEDGKITLTAGAGVKLGTAAREAAQYGAEVFAFAAGIPGTVGGAVYMNAGAYDGEIKDYLQSVLLLDGGEPVWKSADELQLGYRSSLLQSTGDCVLAAKFRFPEGNPKQAKEKIEEFARRRKEKQPLEYPSAGSTFQRPENAYAGKLIMEAGLAGLRIGGAEVSQKHCGFIINKGNASACDVLRLVSEVQRVVLEKYKIRLQLEIRLLGDF